MSRPDATSRIIPPYKDCTEKFTACHDRCPKDKRGEYGYGAWKAEREKENAARKEYAFRASIFSKIS